MLLQALCIISWPFVNSNWSYSPKTPNLGQNGQIFSRVSLQFDLWPWKTIGQLFYVTSSFVHHFITIIELKLELQSGNAQFGSKSMNFFSRVTSKFDVWPSKTIGHLFYATLSFVHHFIAIGEFKLELKSGNAQSGSNSTIFSAVWPWNLAMTLNKANLRNLIAATCLVFLLKFYPNHRFFSPCDLEIWCMT